MFLLNPSQDLDLSCFALNLVHHPRAKKIIETVLTTSGGGPKVKQQTLPTEMHAKYRGNSTEQDDKIKFVHAKLSTVLDKKMFMYNARSPGCFFPCFVLFLCFFVVFNAN